MLINPSTIFFGVNLLALSCFLFFSNETISLLIIGAKKSDFSIKVGFAWFVILTSFYLGTKLINSKIGKNKVDQVVTKKIIQIHYISLMLSCFSTILILLYLLSLNIPLFTYIICGQSNLIKIAVYESNNLFQILMMPRHLILSSLITSFYIKNKNSRHISFLIIVFVGVALTFCTSSRLTLFCLFVIWFLLKEKLKSNEKKLKKYSLVLFLCAAFLIFGVGVYSRSHGFWSNVAESDNILITSLYELLAYTTSPVNYSCAIVNSQDNFDLSLMLSYSFSAFFSVFNIENEKSMGLLLEKINAYWNPDLNQIGLLGQVWSGFSYLFWIPVLFFGAISQYVYQLYKKNSIYGICFYPLVLVCLFDSFRGFLLTQNIICANILFMFIMLKWKTIQ